MGFCEGPCSCFAIVRESDEEVEGVFGDFRPLFGGFVVEGAEAGFDGFSFEKFGVEVGDGAGGEMFEAEVGVAGALGLSVFGFWEVAGEVGVKIQLYAEGVFEEG